MTTRPGNAIMQPVLVGDVTTVVLGLDLSLVRTGVALIVPPTLTTWNLSPGDKLRGVARLSWYRDKIRGLIDDVHPGKVVIEGYAFARPNQAHQIGELGGVVRLALMDWGGQWYEVPPASMKKFVTGMGNAKKNVIPLHLYKRWKLEVEQEDQADATGLAMMGLCHQDPDADGWAKYQVEQMDKMVNKSLVRHRSR